MPLAFGASLRSCSVGPPRSTIHGRARLTRHPCRVAHYAEPERSLSMGQENQKPKQSKSKARRPDSRPDCRTVRNPIVGADLLAKDVQTTRSSRQGALSLTSFASKPAPTGDWGICNSQVGCQAASLLFLIWVPR
ncbi:hypothetical protein CGA21_20185 [Pseudomonas sp. PSB11]|nr:hypothetical protein [Pseudomonas sp. PSB11]